MFTLALENQTQMPMVPYPVVTNPPPPHRAEDAAGAVAARDRELIDISGFNPAYYQEKTKVGLLIQLALLDEPPVLLVVTYQYKVPPGQAGSDPTKQPIKLAEYFFSPTKEKILVRVEPLMNSLGISIREIGPPV
jgi:hypothetical protein